VADSSGLSFSFFFQRLISPSRTADPSSGHGSPLGECCSESILTHAPSFSCRFSVRTVRKEVFGQLLVHHPTLYDSRFGGSSFTPLFLERWFSLLFRGSEPSFRGNAPGTKTPYPLPSWQGSPVFGLSTFSPSGPLEDVLVIKGQAFFHSFSRVFYGYLGPSSCSLSTCGAHLLRPILGRSLCITSQSARSSPNLCIFPW